MNAKEYLIKAEKPKIVIIDRDGRRIETITQNTTRPALDELRKLCSRDGTFHRVTFEDTVKTTVVNACMVCEAELWYDNVKVGHRVFPDILLNKDDDFILKFVLIIVVDHSQVTLG